MDASMVQRSAQEVIYDDTSTARRIGLLALSTDLQSERDFARIIGEDKASVYTSRVAFDNPSTPDNLRKMAPRLTASAELLLPDLPLDAICYSCTAASVVIGDDAITEAVQAAKPGIPVVTPTGAARAGLKAPGARRVSILTPYLIETSQPMAAYFSEHGLDVLNLECLGIADDREIARVSRETIIEAACRVVRDDAEAIFISCTALPAAAAVAEIEQRTGKPVVTSNQASAWACLRHAGISAPIAGYGRLMELPLP
jgi:maleate isomerase